MSQIKSVKHEVCPNLVVSPPPVTIRVMVTVRVRVPVRVGARLPHLGHIIFVGMLDGVVPFRFRIKFRPGMAANG